MKLFTLFCLASAILLTASSEIQDELCKQPTKCKQTDYRQYVDCISKNRTKRDLCQPSRNTASEIVQAPVQNLLQPCRAGCDFCLDSCVDTCSGSGCNDRCVDSCHGVQTFQPLVYTRIVPPIVIRKIVPPIIQAVSSTTTAPPNFTENNPKDVSPEIIDSVKDISKNPTTFKNSEVHPNITTIIKLTNIVNNTNVINAPTNITNGNINNVDIGSNGTSQHDQKCCVVVQPKVCHKIFGAHSGVRCIHRRHHTCGDQCSSEMVHAQVRQPCNGPPEKCPPSVAYVPQPQPRCSYQSSWPYVACGVRPKSCGGCYDHYGYGFQQYHGPSQPDCAGCFDDGFQPGSLYRKGPFYQPGYYHTPPMYNQPQMPQTYCGIGCFRNERTDPAFGVQSYSPYGILPRYPQPSYFPNFNLNNNIPILTFPVIVPLSNKTQENDTLISQQRNDPLPFKMYPLSFSPQFSFVQPPYRPPFYFPPPPIFPALYLYPGNYPQGIPDITPIESNIPDNIDNETVKPVSPNIPPISPNFPLFPPKNPTYPPIDLTTPESSNNPTSILSTTTYSETTEENFTTETQEPGENDYYYEKLYED